MRNTLTGQMVHGLWHLLSPWARVAGLPLFLWALLTAPSPGSPSVPHYGMRCFYFQNGPSLTYKMNYSFKFGGQTQFGEVQVNGGSACLPVPLEPNVSIDFSMDIHSRKRGKGDYSPLYVATAKASNYIYNKKMNYLNGQAAKQCLQPKAGPRGKASKFIELKSGICLSGYKMQGGGGVFFSLDSFVCDYVVQVDAMEKFGLNRNGYECSFWLE